MRTYEEIQNAREAALEAAKAEYEAKLAEIEASFEKETRLLLNTQIRPKFPGYVCGEVTDCWVVITIREGNSFRSKRVSTYEIFGV